MRTSSAFSLLLTLFTSAFAQNNFQCPRDDRTVVTDANGEQYIIGCRDDTYPGSNANQRAADSFNDCFSICSSSPTTCGGFTYVGGSNGLGSGICYLKPAQNPSYFAGNSDASFVGAINLRYYQGPTAASTGAAPEETFACPANDGQVIRDLSGVQYVLGCFQDTLGGSFANQQVSNGFDGCFYFCSNNILGQCSYFTFVGSASSVQGVGTCWFKLGSRASFTGNSNSWVGAIQLDSYGGAAITWPSTTATPTVMLSRRQAQALSTVYYTTVQYVTATVVTSYPVTATSVSTRLVTYTSSLTVTATRITTLPDVTTTLQLTSIVPTTVVTTQIYTTVISTLTTLQLTTVVPTTVVTTRFGTTVQVTTVVNTQTTTIIPVVTVTPTTVFGQTITVTPSFG